MTDDASNIDPPPPPRAGCNPLVFGVVAATIQLAIVLWLLFAR